MKSYELHVIGHWTKALDDIRKLASSFIQLPGYTTFFFDTEKAAKAAEKIVMKNKLTIKKYGKIYTNEMYIEKVRGAK